MQLKDELVSKGQTAANINVQLATMGTVFNYAVNNDLGMSANPAKGVSVTDKVRARDKRDAFLTKHRDHTNAWRQTKLEHYQEYVAALSAHSLARGNDDTGKRLTDATNALALVASHTVLDAVESFQRETSVSNPNRNFAREPELYSAVIQAMRDDIRPKKDGTERPRQYRYIAAPDLRK